MLRVWLPLLGNLDNQGVSNIKIENMGAVSANSAGKIGQCMSFNGTGTSNIRLPAILKNTDDFSITCWVKFNTTVNQCLFSQRTAINGAGFTIFYLNGTDIRLDEGGSVSASGVVSANTWYHIACCRDATKTYIYINGVYKGGGNRSSTSASNVNANYSFIGGSQSDAAGSTVQTNANMLNGYLNDYRIYDHCLSAAEVHEIAQGLICHYKLDVGSYSQTNLLPCGLIYTVESPLVRTSKATDGVGWVSNSAFEATPSATYTISVECDGTLSNAHGPGGLSPADKPWSYWLYICNTNTSKNWQSAAYDTAVNLNRSNNNYRKIGNAHVWTYTLSSTQKYISVRTNTYSNGTDNITVKFWNLKIEKGNTYTSWSGSTDTMIYDSSGFGHNGTHMGGGMFESSSPRYSSAFAFSGNVNNRIQCNTSDFNLTDNFSFSAWIRANYTGTAGQYLFTVGRADAGSYGYGFQNTADTTLRVKFGNKNYDVTITKNTWTHIAFTKSGTAIKVYKNGTVNKNVTFDGTLPTYTECNGVGIGCFHYTGGNIYPGYGAMSDFRIYCTALTDDDIKRQYQLGAKVDNKGNIYGYEFVDNQPIKITKQGQVKALEVTEFPDLFKYDLEVYTEADGTKWAHIFHHNAPASNKFASTDTFTTSVYKNENMWFNFSCCNYMTTYEFLSVSKRTASDTPFRCRWIQSKPPLTITFEESKVANITRITSGYDTCSYGGLYHVSGSSWLAANNGTNNNWFGATGCWTAWNNGIPGWRSNASGDAIKDGSVDIYVRIDNMNLRAKATNTNTWQANQLIEI